MEYKKECPYCHGLVHEKVSVYSHDYGMYGYRFFCECRDDEVDIRNNEDAAYQTYLKQREQSNLTNFDRYFKNETSDQLDKNIEEWCNENDDLECSQCFYAKIASNIIKDIDYPTCIDLMDWLQEKVYKK